MCVMEDVETVPGITTPGGTTGARDDEWWCLRTLWPYGDRPEVVASVLTPAVAVASRVSVLLLARMEATSRANVVASNSVSELDEDDEDGLPGRSEADEMERS